MPPAAATTTKKRKSDATITPAAAKKAKLAAAAHAETVENILSDEKDFEIPDSPSATRKMILGLAQYARNLEEEVDATKPKALTGAELEAASDKLANAVRSGIRKQLTVGYFFKESGATHEMCSLLCSGSLLRKRVVRDGYTMAFVLTPQYLALCLTSVVRPNSRRRRWRQMSSKTTLVIWKFQFGMSFFCRYLPLFSLMTFGSMKKVRHTSSHVRCQYPMEARGGHLQVQWILREIGSESLNES